MTQEDQSARPPLTLDSEIPAFADSLPYWAKYLSARILSGSTVSEADIDTAYSYLLQDAGLKESSKRLELRIDCSRYGAGTHEPDLVLSQITDVEGVNALLEGQTITFGPAVTVVYGANASGKTGYIRILKNAFFSRTTEQILPNVRITAGHKEASAKFGFISNGKTYTLEYPGDAGRSEFEQFAVFDVKSITVHLNNKNQFEFRPAKLNFFPELAEAYSQVEDRLATQIAAASPSRDYASLFDGDSGIRTLLEALSAKTEIEQLRRHIPLTESERQNKITLEEEKARLLTLKKDKEIEEFDDIKELIENLKLSITDSNKLLSNESLAGVNAAIADCAAKEALAREKGVTSFATDLFTGIGSAEWKAFIEAASDFARKQESETHPVPGDPCLLCHQPLSQEAAALVSSYWAFLRSEAEAEATRAQDVLADTKDTYETMSFVLLPEDGLLTKWLKDNYPEALEVVKALLMKQERLCQDIVSAITARTTTKAHEITIATSTLDSMVADIETTVKHLQEIDPGREIEAVNRELTYLTHKDKLQEHIGDIENYVSSLKWAESAARLKAQLSTRKITEAEKDLSSRYFGASYMAAFEDECDNLDANFGVTIKRTGASGVSYRELRIGNRNPADVLSEGEQKVISLADFLSEVRLSGVNRGIILDDPVNSLDEQRKSNIADRLVTEAKERQVIIFTHDLVFLSSLLGYCEELKLDCKCHWVEQVDGEPGRVWLENAPSYEQTYKNAGKAQDFCSRAKDSGPEEREDLLKGGFAALRTSYESLVVFDLFGGVVRRFDERVRIDSLDNVYFDVQIRDEIVDSFRKCCRYMEGHSHSDKFAYTKPTTKALQEEIQRFIDVRRKLKTSKPSSIG